MGAVVPIVGAVVGTASAVNSVSSQNQAAADQRRALDKQANAIETNSELRQIEIEQQRAFLRQQQNLNSLAREQEILVADAQHELEEMALDQQRQQTVLDSQLQNQITQADSTAAKQQLANQYFTNKQQLRQSADLDRLQTDLQFYSSLGLEELGFRDRQFGNTVQYRQAMSDLNQQEIQLKEQTVGALDQIAQEYRLANRQQKQALRTRALNMVAIATGGQLTESDRALISAGDEELLQNSVDMALRSGKTRDLITSAEKYRTDLIELNRGLATSAYEFGEASNLGTSLINKSGLLTQKRLSDFGRDTQLNLSNLSLDQQQALANLNLDRATLLQINLNDANTQNQLHQLGVDEHALDVLKQAQDYTYRLADAQDRLNYEFAGSGLTSQSISAGVAGTAQLAQIDAQRSATRSSGSLGYLQAGLSAAGTIYGAFGGGGATTAPTNPYYAGAGTTGSSSGLLSYSAPDTSANQVWNAGNYSLLGA